MPQKLYTIISNFTKKQLEECLAIAGLPKTGNKPACQVRLWDACGVTTAKYRPTTQHSRYVVQQMREEVLRR